MFYYHYLYCQYIVVNILILMFNFHECVAAARYKTRTVRNEQRTGKVTLFPATKDVFRILILRPTS